MSGSGWPKCRDSKGPTPDIAELNYEAEGPGTGPAQAPIHNQTDSSSRSFPYSLATGPWVRPLRERATMAVAKARYLRAV